jgi:arylsulfatase A-like enzyme
MSTRTLNRPESIILITVDTLRADHTGCYGYPLPTTPTLDRLAAESTRFEQAFSPISYTVPAHASIFTGKNPRFHSIGFYNGEKTLNQAQEITLAAILREQGYQTAGFVSIVPLHKEAGLDLGMQFYDDAFTGGELNRPQELRRSADQTTLAVLDWIFRHRGQPFFLWVHYVEPHGPYMPPAPYNKQFSGHAYSDSGLSLEVVEDAHPGGIPAYQVLKPRRNPAGRLISYEKNYDYYVAQYDGQIRFLDDQLKVLIQKLKDWGLYDEALLLLTSDHGEALGENNIYFFHGLTVSLEQIKVPLLIKPPAFSGLKAGTLTTPVTTLDIMPTVLGFCGLEAGYLGIQGLDLFPLLSEQQLSRWPDRLIFSEMLFQLSIIQGPFQFLFGKGRESLPPEYSEYTHVAATDGTHLFNYVDDPNGTTDIAAAHPAVVTKLLAVARQYLSLPVPEYRQAGQSRLSEGETMEVKKRLSQLGYLGGPAKVNLSPRNTAENKVRQLEDELRGVYRTRSWRWTAPLRKAGKELSNLGRAIRPPKRSR